jgi:hypothetical protein
MNRPTRRGFFNLELMGVQFPADQLALWLALRRRRNWQQLLIAADTIGLLWGRQPSCPHRTWRRVRFTRGLCAAICRYCRQITPRSAKKKPLRSCDLRGFGLKPGGDLLWHA